MHLSTSMENSLAKFTDKQVHLKVEYYPAGEKRKRQIQVKVDAKRWDSPAFNHRSYLNGHIMVAGGVGSRLIKYIETKRTKT